LSRVCSDSFEKEKGNVKEGKPAGSVRMIPFQWDRSVRPSKTETAQPSTTGRFILAPDQSVKLFAVSQDIAQWVNILRG
jgi:hypothetical protein